MQYFGHTVRAGNLLISSKYPNSMVIKYVRNAFYGWDINCEIT